MNLLLVARSKDKLDALKDELTKAYGIDARVVVMSLTSPTAENWQQLQSELETNDVGLVINNAA